MHTNLHILAKKNNKLFTTTENKYLGCFLGLAMGDAYGAPFEGGILERLLWQALGKTKEGKMRYTDDTQMSIDIARSFLHNNEINQKHLALSFATSYRWSRGYGQSAARLLKKIKKGADWQDVNRAAFKMGSFGNGAAMRAPIVAMCFAANEKKLHENIVKCSEITHAHPLAIEGATLIAQVTYAALYDWHTDVILETLPTWCHTNIYQTKVAFCVDALRSLEKIETNVLKKNLGNGIAATQSCVTAIYFALKYRNQAGERMLTKIYQLGGDTDTIGAMAGAIWGAFNGYDLLDLHKIQKLENSEEIMELARRLYASNFQK